MIQTPLMYMNNHSDFIIEQPFQFPSVEYENHSQFLHLMDENETTNYFIMSIQNDEWDNVRNLLSMTLRLDDSVDVKDLKQFFEGQDIYKTYTPRRIAPGSIRTKSLYLRDKKNKQSGIVHIHLQREQDGWKIMGVERE